MSFSRQLRRKKRTPFGDGHSVRINTYIIGNFTRATIACEKCSCKYEAKYEAKYENTDGNWRRNKNIGTDIALQQAREEFLKLPSCSKQQNLDITLKIMTS
jgi:hypothetical protein